MTDLYGLHNGLNVDPGPQYEMRANAAFSCGLDPSTKEPTNADVRNLEAWYERTLGWVPPRVAFLAKRDPRTP